MSVSMWYICKNCGHHFSKDTDIELFSENLEEQLKVSERNESVIDTWTGATYPLNTLHQCEKNEYGIGTLTRVEVT